MENCNENITLAGYKGRPISTNDPSELSKHRKKKFTGGNASKRHRDRVNIEFNNLAKLLPFPESVVAKLDKSSILRLAVSYIRAKSFFKDVKATLSNEVNHVKDRSINNNGSINSRKINRIREGTGLVTEFFSQALDGFLLVLTEDMKVLYVSESVRDYLGYCQAGIIHENFLQFINPGDESLIKSALKFDSDENSKKDTPYDITDRQLNGTNCSSQISSSREDEAIASPLAQRKFICRMKCAFSCSSRFYTAYRTFEFSGHLKRSSIREGRGHKKLNTLVVFGTPLNNNEKKLPHDISHDIKEDTVNQVHDESIMCEESGSFRIEPTLRPHIAPIAITKQDGLLTRQRNTMNIPKSRDAPTLIPIEVYLRDNVRTSNNLQAYHNRHINVPVSSNNCESRLSDHSDDSKCSPVQSPNLSWKVNRRPTTPLHEETFKYLNRQSMNFNRHNEIALHEEEELEYYKRNFKYRAEFSPIRNQRISESYSYINDEHNKKDIYQGVKMLMGLKEPLTYDKYQYVDRKRKSEYINEHYTAPKRNKSSSPGIASFNIRHLLGFEDESDNESTNNSKENEQYIDVCEIEEDSSKENTDMHDIIHKMSRNLDATFRKTMASS